MIDTTSLYEFFLKRRPKWTPEPVDRIRYSVLQRAIEKGEHALVEEPPRSGKTEAVAVILVAWWLSSHPNYKFGFITHSQALGQKFLADVVSILRDLGFQFEYVRASEFKLKGSAGIDPSYWVSGIGGGHTGKGANCLIISDVLRSGTDAMSQKIRESIITDVVSTGMNRLEPYTLPNGSTIPGFAIFEQARLHEDDPCGWLMKSGLNYIQHHFPCWNDDGRSAWVKNTYTGEIFYAEPYNALTRRQPRPLLDQIKAYSTEYFFFCQYLMVCGIGLSNYFDLTRCRRYEHVPQVSRWWAACDFANTATISGSRTAFCAMGLNDATGQLSVIGAQAGRYRADEMGDQMIAFLNAIYRLTGLRPEACIVERAAQGYSIIDFFQNSLPIVPITPLGSKEERAAGVAHMVAKGLIHLPSEAPWLKEFESEVGGFPLATLNDLADSFVHCLDYAVRPSEFRLPSEEGMVEYDTIEQYESSFSEENQFDLEVQRDSWRR
jgi:phage terminase large subunit-like protein